MLYMEEKGVGVVKKERQTMAKECCTSQQHFVVPILLAVHFPSKPISRVCRQQLDVVGIELPYGHFRRTTKIPCHHMSSGMKPTGLKASDGRVIVVSRVADAGIAMKFALFWSALIGCLLSDVKSNSHPVQRFWEAVQKSGAITLQLDARFGRGACRSTRLVPTIRTACSASLARTGFPKYGTPPKRWPSARPKIIPGLNMDAESSSNSLTN